MTHTQTQGADGAGTNGTLWCMHIAGPDDVHAAPDFWTALAWSAELNAAVAARAIKQGWAGDDNWPLAQATVQRWPWSAEGHADSLATELAARAAQKATPAQPAATPGVPDSLREAFAAATDSPVFVHDFADPAVSPAPGCQDVSLSFVTPDHITAAFMGNGLAGTIDQARKDAVALAAAWNHFRALIAAQPGGQDNPGNRYDGWSFVSDGKGGYVGTPPAGQAGDAGADDPRDAAEVELQEIADGAYGSNPMTRGAARDRLSTLHAMVDRKLERYRANKSAPDSTRTGVVEPCLRAVVEVYSGRTDTRLTFGKGVKHEGGCKAVEQAIIALQAELDQRDACPAAGGPSAGYGGTGAKALSAAILAQCAYPRICSSNGRVAEGIRCGPCERKALAAALAARPEAPSDAGWNFDMEAAPRDGTPLDLWCHGRRSIDYRWDAEGRFGGWWSDTNHKHRHWRDRECLLADQPTAWRLADTPPSDPAPSGQAEG